MEFSIITLSHTVRFDHRDLQPPVSYSEHLMPWFLLLPQKIAHFKYLHKFSN